jgi:glutaredoxin
MGRERVMPTKLPTAKPRVIVYSRPGCHLCDDAKQEIEAADCRDEYTLEVINIESDPGLLGKYCDDIPVITIDGVEVFRHRVSSSAFRECLREIAATKPPASR